jgi:hypothetical protein
MSNALIPDHEVEIAGTTYVLDGSLATLKDVQHLVDEDIYSFIFSKITRCRFELIAKLFAIGIQNAGKKPPELATIEKEIVEEKGINWARGVLLIWLEVASTPKRDREKKKKDLVDAINKMNSYISPGSSTENLP